MVDKPHTTENDERAYDGNGHMPSSRPKDDDEIENGDAGDPEGEPKKKRKVGFRGRWKGTSTANRMIAIATIVSAISTCTYAVFTYLQWRALSEQIYEIKSGSADTHDLAVAAKKQSEQAEAQTRKMGESLQRTDNLIGATNTLAKESKRSADIAKNALDSNTRTFRLDERPWIMGFRFQIANEPEENKPLPVNIWVTNTGKTPAIDVVPQWKLFSWDTEPLPTEFGLPIGAVISRGIISPGSTAVSFTTDPIVFNTTQLAAYNAGNTRIYVHARIVYKDIFNEQHWTSLCIIHKHGMPLDSWNYCEHGNDADHDQTR